MGTDEEAQAAISALNGRSIGGRNLRVNESIPQAPRSGGFGGGGGGGGGFGGGGRRTGGGGGSGGAGGGGGWTESMEPGNIHWALMEWALESAEGTSREHAVKRICLGRRAAKILRAI
jgi:hypothetical protein